MDREILNEYYQTYEYHVDRIEQFDRRIEDLASDKAYAEKVKKLRCFLGIETVTAVALIEETGDFSRFRKGNTYGAYLGLVPGEKSSGDSYRQGGVTKAGNKHLRRLLTEAAQSICKGTVGHKSKALKARQRGNDSETIAYADRANERLRRKYYQMIHRGKKRNTAVAAVSRELGGRSQIVSYQSRVLCIALRRLTPLTDKPRYDARQICGRHRSAAQHP